MVKFCTKIAVLFFFGFLPALAFAATLFISPATATYNVGQTFSVVVYAGSSNQALNAASGIISFPNDKLEVVSLSKTGSILSLWAQEPSFSNSVGTVSFEGVVPNPGFTGATGKIINITFRAKTAGVARLNFSSGSILANDGLGTDILSSQTGTSFNISSDESTTAPEPDPIVPVVKQSTDGCAILPVIDIVSSTNKPDAWVSNNDSSFSWIVPANASAIRTSLSAKADSVPGVNYVPPIAKKDLTGTPNGIWYFALRYRVGACWSLISRYQIMIDTVAPSDLRAEVVEMGDNTKLGLALGAKDALSGLNRYEIVVDDKTITSVLAKDLIDGQYPLNNLPSGGHNLRIRVFDFAGNSSKDISLAVSIPARVTEMEGSVASSSSKVSNLLSIFQIFTTKEGLKIILLGGLALLIFILLFYFLNRRKRVIKKSTRKIDIGNIKVFTLMENDVGEYIKVLEKAKKNRVLTDEETLILRGLKKEASALDKFFDEQRHLADKD